MTLKVIDFVVDNFMAQSVLWLGIKHQHGFENITGYNNSYKSCPSRYKKEYN